MPAYGRFRHLWVNENLNAVPPDIRFFDGEEFGVLQRAVPEQRVAIDEEAQFGLNRHGVTADPLTYPFPKRIDANECLLDLTFKAHLGYQRVGPLVMSDVSQHSSPHRGREDPA